MSTSFSDLARLPLHKARIAALRLKTAVFDQFYDRAFAEVEEGTLVVRAPQFSGAFEIGFRSHICRILLKDKEYEPGLVELVERYLDRDRDVIDVGANVGLFTILFSKRVAAGRRVLAVEPTPGALGHLRRNIERNGVSETAIVFEGIATSEPGRYPLNVIEGKEEYSSLGRLSHPAIAGERFRTLEVPGETLDHLVERHSLRPGFLKIDTEGAERLVLGGALETLKTHQPIILAELSERLLANFGATSQEVLHLLRENGYRVLDAENLATPALAPFEGNILALPPKTER